MRLAKAVTMAVLFLAFRVAMKEGEREEEEELGGERESEDWTTKEEIFGFALGEEEVEREGGRTGGKESKHWRIKEAFCVGKAGREAEREGRTERERKQT